MQSILARRTATLVGRSAPFRVAGSRTFAGDAASASDVAMKDIAAGLGLGLVIAGGWMVWARGQFGKLDTFNEKLRASKAE